MTDRLRWAPASILLTGALLVFSVREPRAAVLREPLASLPGRMDSLTSVDRALDPAELAANGASDYLLRYFGTAAAPEQMSVYVGFYAHQRNGKSIHSPKNCLPASGWEPLSAEVQFVNVPGGSVPINRYVLAQRGERALVYYWYQGRGRVAASEYLVKWELLRDAALTGHTEEAMVRIVVPLDATMDDATADRLAAETVRLMVPALRGVLPA